MHISENVPNTEFHVVNKVINMSVGKGGNWEVFEVDPTWHNKACKRHKELLSIFLFEFALLGTKPMAALIESVKG